MYIIMGLNAPNSKYFCLYCDCQSEMRWDMDQSHENLGNNACKSILRYVFYLLVIIF
jgi:hypothetical protein